MRLGWTPRVGCVVLLLALVQGCSGVVDQQRVADASTSIRGVEVTGEPGRAPVVRIAAPLDIDRTRSRTLVEGTGPELFLDRIYLLELAMYDARTGEKAVSTYDRGKAPLTVSDSDMGLFPVLVEALTGQRQGSRIVVMATAADTFGDDGAPQYGIAPGDDLVLVADILAVPPKEVLSGPRGTTSGAPAGVPTVQSTAETTGGVPAGLTFTGMRKPDELVVVPLVNGTGPEVSQVGLVTLDYLGQVWDSATPFTNTFAKEPVTLPIGVDRMIPGWESALVGVRRGSRLLVLVPPRLGYQETGSPPDVPGDATLAYVVDVLGVS